MKKEFSKSWISSAQRRKQRKYIHNAPLHIRHRLLSAHLQKGLRAEHGRRSLPVRRGDEVEIMRGEFKRRRGAVTRVDTQKLKVYVENVKRKRVSGQEVGVPVSPSNLMIIRLSADDKKRQKILSRKKPTRQGE